MSRFARLLLLSTILAIAPGAVPATPAPAAQDLSPAIDTARSAVRAFVANDTKALHALANESVRLTLTPALVRRLSQTLAEEHGRLVAVGEGSALAEVDRTIVTVPAFLQRRTLVFVVTTQPDGLVARIRIAAHAPSAAAAPRADYDRPAAYREQRLALGSAGAIEGELVLSIPVEAAPPVPVVLIAPPLEPDARDGLMSGVDVARDLAGGLATAGVAAARLSGGPGPDAGEPASVAMVSAALEVLQDQPHLDRGRIYLLAHGGGAALAAEVAAADAASAGPQLAGLILLGAPARPALDVLVTQLEHRARADGEISPRERDAIDSAVALRPRIRAQDESPVPDFEIAGLSAISWQRLDAVHPTHQVAAALARRPALRILLLHAGHDDRATAEDAAIWRQRFHDQPRVEMRLLADLGGLFDTVPASPTPLPGYLRPGHVDAAVIDALITWIRPEAD